MRGRAMPLLLFAMLLGGALPAAAIAQDQSTATLEMRGDFRHEVFKDADGAHRYVVFVPPGYDASRRWPVILSLHGAGERGRDGRAQLTVGMAPLVELHPEKFPAVIVFPQVEETDERILTAWSPDNPDGRRALAILAEVERKYSIDPGRRILAGWSMGGYGVWLVAAGSEPGFWSAALSVSGGATADVATKLPAGLPMWAIHGAEDRIVQVGRMEQAVEAARGAGRSVESTIVKGAGHDIWQVVFGRPEVLQWMFDPTSIRPRELDWSASQLATLREQNPLPERPFRASAVISRAVAIRIGNEAFSELARGIPDAIPPERLSGKVADIEQSVTYGGSTIEVGIRGIEWSADLVEARVHAVEAERLLIRVGLKNLKLRPTGGDLAGGEYEASCGPFEVVLGRRRPVWVEVTTRPRIVAGTIELTERDIRFSIPDDNWFVTEPTWAKAKGKGLTPDLVKVGVVGGMYRSKKRVEEAVRELIPPLIERIEGRLVQVPPDSLASLLWPLPTSPPRIRLVPEGIRTDSGGVSVTVGLAVEGPTSQPGRSTLLQTPIHEGRSSGVIVGVAPKVLSSVAAVLANDPGARLDVRDAPDSTLARLGDESLLRRAAPGLADGSTDFELRTVLSLPDPFSLELDTLQGDSTGRLDLKLVAPDVLLEISRRPRDRSGAWQKCIDCRVSLEHRLAVELNGDNTSGRSVTMRWDPDPAIKGLSAFAAGFTPSVPTLDNDQLVGAFDSAWRDWTAQAGTTTPVDDLAVGPARLRLNAIPARGGRIWLEFEPFSH